MFRTNIKLIDPIPEEYVKTLRRLEFEPDYSLTCLGISLLKPRMTEYKGITGYYSSITSEDACVKDFLQRFHNPEDVPVLCYYNYSVSGNKEENLKLLKDAGFKVKENIGTFLKEKASVDCLAIYHEERNFAGVFINTRDIRYYHMLISFISLLFPALFKNQPLKEEEYGVIVALSKTNEDAFIQKIQESVHPYVMEFRNTMLCNLLKSMHEVKINNALASVRSQRDYIKNLEDQYADAMNTLKNLIVTYEGMKATEHFDEPEQELVEYLSENKSIHNLKINGNKLSFSVAAKLNNYNPDAWAKFSERGSIYNGEYKYQGTQPEMLDVFKKESNRRLLLDNLFNEDPEFTIKIAGNYTLDLYTCRISTNNDYDYKAADPMYKSYLPNPHLKLYRCLGGYEYRVMDALKDRNFIGAIEMCCASAGSVDLDEVEQTFRPFIGWILSSREKILTNKDGEDVTPEEALLYLIDKGENK